MMCAPFGSEARNPINPTPVPRSIRKSFLHRTKSPITSPHPEFRADVGIFARDEAGRRGQRLARLDPVVCML
jgi:hypothetical protein